MSSDPAEAPDLEQIRELHHFTFLRRIEHKITGEQISVYSCTMIQRCIAT